MAANKRGNSTRRSTERSSGSKSTSSRRKNVREEELDYSLKSELIVIGMVALTIFLFLCNFGVCGALGSAVSGVLFGLFGITAYIAPLVILAAVVVGIANFGSSASIRKIVAGIVLFFVIGMLAELLTGRPQSFESYNIGELYTKASELKNGGGVFAGSMAYASYKYLSLAGTALLILLIGIASVVVVTQQSFVGGLKKGGRKLIDKTRQEADNYRDYAEKRREKMEARRAEIEEERRLAIEQKEDEKILRMEKKVSGVMIDTALDKQEEDGDDLGEIKLHNEEKGKSENIFIPDEDEFHDDIHEIILKNSSEAIEEIESAGRYEPEEDYEPEPEYEPDYREEEDY